MRRSASFPLLLAAMAVLCAHAARAEVVVHLTTPVQFLAEVPCADRGRGELVLLSGILHARVNQTVDANEAVHASLHVQPQGIVGVGLSTGDVYHSTGVTRETFNLNRGALTHTYVNNFRIIGVGPRNNALVHQVMHVTLGPDREFVVVAGFASVSCR